MPLAHVLRLTLPLPTVVEVRGCGAWHVQGGGVQVALQPRRSDNKKGRSHSLFISKTRRPLDPVLKGPIPCLVVLEGLCTSGRSRHIEMVAQHPQCMEALKTLEPWGT